VKCPFPDLPLDCLSNLFAILLYSNLQKGYGLFAGDRNISPMVILDEIAGRKALIEAAGIKTGRVLNVVMGNCGCTAFFLAGDGFQVVGIDNSPEAVRKSRRDAQKESFSGSFEARVANGGQLPFAVHTTFRESSFVDTVRNAPLYFSNTPNRIDHSTKYS
jgi:hypothetical protein